MKKSNELKATIEELISYKEMMEALKKEMEVLENELKVELTERGLTEILVEDHKVTYNQVISNRFDSTSFKKDFLDIYKEYTKPSSSMRLTVN